MIKRQNSNQDEWRIRGDFCVMIGRVRLIGDGNIQFNVFACQSY